MKEAVAGASDEVLMTPWALLAGGKNFFTMPRIAALKSIVLNHIIHHRARLGVYLRMNDVPIPGMYGPSADETPAMQRVAVGRLDRIPAWEKGSVPAASRASTSANETDR